MANTINFAPETWEQKHILDYLRDYPGAIYETVQRVLGFDEREFYRAYRRLRDLKQIEHRVGDFQHDLFLVETPKQPRKTQAGMKCVTIDYRPGHDPAATTDKFYGW